MRRRTRTVGFLGEHRRSCAAEILQTSEISIEEYDGLSLYEPVFGVLASRAVVAAAREAPPAMHESHGTYTVCTDQVWFILPFSTM